MKITRTLLKNNSPFIFLNRKYFVDERLNTIVPILGFKSYGDRTNTFNEYNVKIDPIPKNFEKSKKIGDCCIERAISLWEQHDQITIMWSGGIDSSAALIALNETKPNSKILKIFYTKESIKEFPFMYESLVKYISPISSNRFVTDYDFLLTGECSDQCHGHQSYESMLDVLDSPWEDLFFGLYKRLPISPKIKRIINDKEMVISSDSSKISKIFSNENSYETYKIWSSIASKCPFPIETIKQFTWWVNFTQQWMYIQYHVPFYFEDARESYDWTRYNAFFNSQNFQKWALNHHSQKIPLKDYRNYKQELKDWIYIYVKDKNYKDNKLKVGSYINLTTLEGVKKIHDNTVVLVREDKVVLKNKDLKNPDVVEYIKNIPVLKFKNRF